MVKGRNFPWEPLRKASCHGLTCRPPTAHVRHPDTESATTLPLPRHVGQGDMSSAIAWLSSLPS